MQGFINEFKYYAFGEMRVSNNTYVSYERDIKQYIKYLEEHGVRDPEDITVEILKDYLKYLKTKRLEPASVSRKLSSIKCFHKFLQSERYTKVNITKNIDAPKQAKKLPVVLSIEEVDKLLNSLKYDTPIEARNKAMIELDYASGLRVSELVNLKLGDLHFDDDESGGFVQVYGKGNKERIVPVGEVAVKAINYYIKEARPKLIKKHTDYLFLNHKDGNQISRQMFFIVLNKKVEEAGIRKKVSPHKLRHSFASHLLKNGVDLRLIQELLGHEDISTTERYVHIQNADMNQTYVKMHPRAKEQEEIKRKLKL